MTVPIRLRQPLVILGVLVALLAGAATIRAAAAWTATSSPLAAKPPSVEGLRASLATEQARSAALEIQLDQLTAGSNDLAAALEAARDRIASDAGHATELQARLTAAKAKLAALERSIRQARATVAAPAPVAAPATVVAVTRGDDGDREPEGGDD